MPTFRRSQRGVFPGSQHGALTVSAWHLVLSFGKATAADGRCRSLAQGSEPGWHMVKSVTRRRRGAAPQISRLPEPVALLGDQRVRAAPRPGVALGAQL